MSAELFFGLFFLIGVLAVAGIHALFFSCPKDYEWRKNMAARKRWIEMMEDKHG